MEKITEFLKTKWYLVLVGGVILYFVMGKKKNSTTKRKMSYNQMKNKVSSLRRQMSKKMRTKRKRKRY